MAAKLEPMTPDKRLLGPRLTFSEAKAKVNDTHSGLKLLSLVHHISLPPKFLQDIRAGIREQLNEQINKYDDSTGGVLVAYSNVKALQQTGSVLGDEPFIHFKVRADAVYFQPQPGDRLLGVVNKVGKDHIGCLVHGIFNVSLGKPRRDCEVKVGDEVGFEVLQATPYSGLLSILGQLRQDEPSAAKRRRTDSPSTSIDPAPPKRPRHDTTSRSVNRTETETERETQILTKSETEDNEASSSSKKKKRQSQAGEPFRSTAEPVLGSFEAKEEDTGVSESAKKKKRKSKSKTDLNPTSEVSSSTVQPVAGCIDIKEEETDESESAKKKKKRRLKSDSETTVASSFSSTADQSLNATMNTSDIRIKDEPITPPMESSQEGETSAKKKKKRRAKMEMDSCCTADHSLNISVESEFPNTPKTPKDDSSQIKIEPTSSKKKKKRREKFESLVDSSESITMDSNTSDSLVQGPSGSKQAKKSESQNQTVVKTEKLDPDVGSPPSDDSAIGSLTNGLDTVHLKEETLTPNQHATASAKKKKKIKDEPV